MIITNENLKVLLKHKYNVSNETIINELKKSILINIYEKEEETNQVYTTT